MSESACLTAALGNVRTGVPVCPLASQLVTGPSGKLNPRPLVKWKTQLLRTEAEVRQFWLNHPDAQLAIVLENGLGAIDVDSGKHIAPPEFPVPRPFAEAYAERTKTGGMHMPFRYKVAPPDATPLRFTGLGGYVDVLLDGLLVVAPSKFENAPGPYEVVTDGEIPVFESVSQALQAAADWLPRAWKARCRGSVGGLGPWSPREGPPAADVREVLKRMRCSGRAGEIAAWVAENTAGADRHPHLCFNLAAHAVAAGASSEQAAAVVGCPEWPASRVSRDHPKLTSRPPAGLGSLLRYPEGKAAEEALSAAPPRRRLPTGDEIAWARPGDGERTSDQCGTMSHYAHTAGDGRKHYRTAPHSCNRRECPTCYGRVAHREASAAERTFFDSVLSDEKPPDRESIPRAEEWTRRPYHITIRPPPGVVERVLSMGEYTDSLRPAAYRKARRHCVAGGNLVLRFDPQPAFHGVVFLRGTHPVPSGPDRDGWTVRLEPVRGSVLELERWLVAGAVVPYTAAEVTLAQRAGGEDPPSAKVSPRVHSVTWFGEFAYASRERVTPIPRGVVCEVCGEFVPFGLWTRQIWIGSGPPPRGHGVCKPEEWTDDPRAGSGWTRDPDTDEPRRRASHSPGFAEWVRARAAGEVAAEDSTTADWVRKMEG